MWLVGIPVVLVEFRWSSPSWVGPAQEVGWWPEELVLPGALGKPEQEVGQEGELLGPTVGLSHLPGGSRGFLLAKVLDIPGP
jgi:hypothetical protein